MPEPAATYTILHRDEQLLVVDKAPGVLSVPAPGSRERCLLDDLRRDGLAVAPVHRLDKETSGVLLLDLDREIRADLEALFRERAVEKTYLALVHGRPRAPRAVVDVPILDEGRTARVDRRGRKAVTRYETVEAFRDATLLRVRMETGRHNQIRVHMAHLGNPLLGDAKFGRRERAPREERIPRAMLHAERLVLEHPGTGERLDVSCPPPADFASLLETLRDGGTVSPPGSSRGASTDGARSDRTSRGRSGSRPARGRGGKGRRPGGPGHSSRTRRRR